MKQPCLAANYSVALERLLAGRPDLVDAVKVSEFDRPEYLGSYAVLGLHWPLLLHGLAGPARPGSRDFGKVFQPEALSRALALTRSQWVSIHLESVGRVEGGFDRPRFLERLATDVDLIRSESGLPVLLENTHFYASHPVGPDCNHPETCDPGFIEAALDATGCDMLLDIAHAQVAASARHESAICYVDRLPLRRVREVHISGPSVHRGELRDRHQETTPEGYLLLERALSGGRIELVTLEYGGVGPVFEARSDPDVLSRQLTRLRGILGGVRQSDGRADGAHCRGERTPAGHLE